MFVICYTKTFSFSLFLTQGEFFLNKSDKLKIKKLSKIQGQIVSTWSRGVIITPWVVDYGDEQTVLPFRLSMGEWVRVISMPLFASQVKNHGISKKDISVREKHNNSVINKIHPKFFFFYQFVHYVVQARLYMYKHLFINTVSLFLLVESSPHVGVFKQLIITGCFRIHLHAYYIVRARMHI